MRDELILAINAVTYVKRSFSDVMNGRNSELVNGLEMALTELYNVVEKEEGENNA